MAGDGIQVNVSKPMNHGAAASVKRWVVPVDIPSQAKERGNRVVAVDVMNILWAIRIVSRGGPKSFHLDEPQFLLSLKSSKAIFDSQSLIYVSQSATSDQPTLAMCQQM